MEAGLALRTLNGAIASPQFLHGVLVVNSHRALLGVNNPDGTVHVINSNAVGAGTLGSTGQLNSCLNLLGISVHAGDAPCAVRIIGRVSLPSLVVLGRVCGLRRLVLTSQILALLSLALALLLLLLSGLLLLVSLALLLGRLLLLLLSGLLRLLTGASPQLLSGCISKCCGNGSQRACYD